MDHWWQDIKPQGQKTPQIVVPAEYEIVPVELLAAQDQQRRADQRLAEQQLQALHAVVWVE